MINRDWTSIIVGNTCIKREKIRGDLGICNMAPSSEKVICNRGLKCEEGVASQGAWKETSRQQETLCVRVLEWSRGDGRRSTERDNVQKGIMFSDVLGPQGNLHPVPRERRSYVT